MGDNSKMVTMPEAAELAGVTRPCIYQWYWRGKLHAVQIDGQLMTTPEEVRRAAVAMSQNPAGRKRTAERAKEEAVTSV